MLERTRSAISSSPSYKWWAFAALGIGTFQSVIAHNSIIVVLPVIADHFDTDLATVQWVVLAELLVLSSLLMPMGRLSDIVGRKQIYTVGLVVFLTGLVLAGFSTSITSLVMAKTLQGVGSAMSQGTAMAMIVSSFPGAERGKALGLNMSVVGAGGITGPVVGGILAGTLGWRWVFLSSVPVGIVALIVAYVVLDSRLYARDTQRPKFDWLGAALSTGTLVTLLLTVTNGHRLGWNSAPIIRRGSRLHRPDNLLYLVGAAYRSPDAGPQVVRQPPLCHGRLGWVRDVHGYALDALPDALLPSWSLGLHHRPSGVDHGAQRRSHDPRGAYGGKAFPIGTAGDGLTGPAR